MKSKSVSLTKWLFWCYEGHKRKQYEGEYCFNNISPVIVAKRGDQILRSERLRIAKEISEKLNYDLLTRAQITDYRYKKEKKNRIKINGRSYLLSKKEFPDPNVPGLLTNTNDNLK